MTLLQGHVTNQRIEYTAIAFGTIAAYSIRLSRGIGPSHHLCCFLVHISRMEGPVSQHQQSPTPAHTVYDGGLTPSDATQRMRKASVKMLSSPEVAIRPHVVASRLADMMLFLRRRPSGAVGASVPKPKTLESLRTRVIMHVYTAAASRGCVWLQWLASLMLFLQQKGQQRPRIKAEMPCRVQCNRGRLNDAICNNADDGEYHYRIRVPQYGREQFWPKSLKP